MRMARAIPLDISKAFDRVWYADFLYKLKSYGISRQIFNFIQSYQNVITSQIGIYVDGKTIYSCLNVKFDRFYKIKLTADIRNDLQSVVNWYKKWLVNVNTSKTKMFSFNRLRKPVFCLSSAWLLITSRRWVIASSRVKVFH